MWAHAQLIIGILFYQDSWDSSVRESASPPPLSVIIAMIWIWLQVRHLVAEDVVTIETFTHLHTHSHTYTHTHTLTHTHTQQRRIKEASVAASWRRRRRRRRRRRCRRLPKIKLATSAENFYGFFFVCELILHWRWLTVQNSIYQLNSLLLLPIYYSASAIHHWLNSVLITANISLTRAQSSQM